MNKYDFNVGDIVEDIDGKFGYISSICHCKKCEERGFYEPTILYEDGTEDYISNYSVKTVHLDYRRIGKYKFSKQILRKNIKKSISWYALWKRIGKQPIYKTQNSKVQVFIDGELRECALVFTNNGSDFHLEPVGKE